MSKYNKIVTRVIGGQPTEEARAVTALTPGHLVHIEQESADPSELKATLQATAGMNSFVVIENTFFGATCKTAIPINDRATVMKCVPGMRFTAIVTGTAAVAINAFLTPHTDGCVIAASANLVAGTADGAISMAPQIFIAKEACALNSTGDARRILVEVIR